MNFAKLNWWHPKVRPDHSNDKYWDSMIHPEDLDKLINTQLKSDIFIIMNELSGFIEIKQLNFTVRVKENCLQKVNYEGFYLNDNVITTNSINRKNSIISGTINQIVYHHKDKILNYYLLDSNNKKISKRYIAIDLVKLEENASR